jgi:transposase-like protein
MDPTTTCCPNLACPARGQVGAGTIGLHARKEQRFICTTCHPTFVATNGTALYRLRTSAATVSRVVTLMAHGCPLQALVAAFGCDERTVARWVACAGVQGQAVHEHLLPRPQDLDQLQADEIRVKERLASLTRRGRALARRTMPMQHGMSLIGTVYNLCTPHASLA